MEGLSTAPETAFVGRTTVPGWGWPAIAPRRCSASATAARRSAWGGAWQLDLRSGDPILRDLDWHRGPTCMQSRAARLTTRSPRIMAKHPHLTTQKGFHLKFSRAQNRAEQITADLYEFPAHPQAVTGERIEVLEGIGEMPHNVSGSAAEAVRFAR